MKPEKYDQWCDPFMSIHESMPRLSSVEIRLPVFPVVGGMLARLLKDCCLLHKRAWSSQGDSITFRSGAEKAV